jgi:hypothetical protein
VAAVHPALAALRDVHRAGSALNKIVVPQGAPSGINA